MKTKTPSHTPGPWKYRQTADTFRTGRPVFGVGPEMKGAIWFVAEQVYEEDARLIATAPELLYLLREWNLAGYFPTHAEWQEWEKDFGERVRAAIAKAEGDK